jgi:alkanesulfonate monooxygenase SsuD/methylene tetrahydromethanopterin reductase-like flavin-dependent oxidoreductase (luciferase family)
MDVAIGLPNAIPGTDGNTLVEWARRSEQAGFSSLGTIGRLVYPSYDDLITLAASAAVTERIRLMTSILVAPLHANTALLAKQTASLDRLSGGRLVLGLAIGSRDDDYVASGLPPRGRGRRLDAQLEELKRIWGGEERGIAGAIGPPPVRPGGPELILGGQGEPTFRRIARYAGGWMYSGGAPESFSELAAALDRAWQDAGRRGKPRKVSQAYFALGPNARQDADSYLKDYYAWLGPIAELIAAGTLVSEEAIRSYVAAFGEVGCDELLIIPCSSELDQVRLLAEAIS